MKTSFQRKKIVTVLLSAMMMTCSAVTFQAPISSAAAECAAPVEEAASFDRVDGLAEGSYSPDTVNILLKQAYSRKYDRVLKKIFSDPMFKSYKALDKSDDADNEDPHLFVSAVLNSKGADAVRKALDYLQEFDEVYYAGPNHLFDIQVQAYIPNDPRTSGDGYAPYDLIQLFDAWDITTGSPNFVLGNAELIKYDHPDLNGQMWTNSALANGVVTETHGANFSRDDRSVYTNDPNVTHGTLTGGIMGARGNNALGSAGVAHGAKLAAVTACGDNQFQQLIEFLNRYNIKVFNISQGWGDTPSVTIRDAIDDYNGLIVCSAGNHGAGKYDPNNWNGRDIDNDTYYPASYSYWRRIPGDDITSAKKKEIANKVIAVAALDNNGNMMQYSNYGIHTVEIGAPANIVSTSFSSPTNNTYTIGGGTSSAAPALAGVLGLIMSANPTLTPSQAREILFDTADHVPQLDGKVQNGRCVNAYNALKKASVDKGTYFFRNKASGRYLDLNTSTNKLISHDFNAGMNQKFVFGNGTLKTAYYNNNNFIGKVSGSQITQISSGKTDIAIAKNMSGSGYRILMPIRVNRNGGQEVDLYALEVSNPGSTISDVVWKKFNPNSDNQIWYAEDATPVQLEDGAVYTFTNNTSISNKMLDLNQSDGKLLLHGLNNGNNQKWRVQSVGNGRYILKTLSTVHPGMLTYINSLPQVGTSGYVPFSLYKNINDMSGEWDGTCRIHFYGSTWCLRVQGDSQSNYAPIIFDSYRRPGESNPTGFKWIYRKVS